MDGERAAPVKIKTGGLPPDRRAYELLGQALQKVTQARSGTGTEREYAWLDAKYLMRGALYQLEQAMERDRRTG